MVEVTAFAAAQPARAGVTSTATRRSTSSAAMRCQPVVLPARPAVFDRNVAVFGVAEVEPSPRGMLLRKEQRSRATAC